ncbi:NYN domain-containing protein [Gordonia shandongensis]|uniref:NYN domain-containing protein n=1 Tax=Gordonia shandongensis TaxID=376351 RepID=UPI000685B3A9|nr:NYN domain-containing protein [Gordonia shandongensis]
MHFIDIENICGTPDLTIPHARSTMLTYHREVGIAEGDHVIIGSSHHNAIAAGNAWRGARLLPPRSGADGADRAIREAIRTEGIDARFATAYLASGDGGFAPELALLAAHGMTTHVVSRPESISRKLRFAAHFTTILDTVSVLHRRNLS